MKVSSQVDCATNDGKNVLRVDESLSAEVLLRQLSAFLCSPQPEEEVEFSDDTRSLSLPLSFSLSFLEHGLKGGLAALPSCRA